MRQLVSSLNFEKRAKQSEIREKNWFENFENSFLREE